MYVSLLAERIMNTYIRSRAWIIIYANKRHSLKYMNMGEESAFKTLRITECHKDVHGQQ
jgi:hypothetical protein